MEKEIISYSRYDLPILLTELNMQAGGQYRGMHSHKPIEIVMVKSGALTCQINNEVLVVSSPQIIFINSDTGHALSSDNAVISYIQIDNALIGGNIKDDAYSGLYEFISHTKAIPYLIFENNSEIEVLLQKIVDKYFENSQYSRWYLRAHLYELAAFMFSCGFISPMTIPSERIKKIELIVAYLNDNFRSALTLDDICTATHYNRYSVCHTFKAVTGSSVFEYVNYLRVRYAIELMKKKKTTILEIATESGYSSATYFNRVFKSVTGCAPTEYRKYLISDVASE